MAKRKLSQEERDRIVAERRVQEVERHPDKMISIRVEDETDDSGEPIVWVHYVGEKQSNDWKRNA